MRKTYILTPLFAVGAVMVMAGCVGTAPVSGQVVTLVDTSGSRTVPADSVNEQSLLRRGYIKNTDGKGGILYVFVPSTDVVNDNPFGSDEWDPDADPTRGYFMGGPMRR